ncbi:MAG: hypothetical protein IT452_02400 [Planctomycetia bacterium]|nr:hypothetical protein [Planctomycetia bacterium]
MAQPDAFASPPPTVTPSAPPLAVPAVIAHLSMFCALGWFLLQVPALKVVYVDLGCELPILTLIVMKIDDLFEACRIPICTIALAGLAVDFGKWRMLRRRGLHRAAENWLWVVAAAIIPITVVLQQVLHLPLASLIESMK